MQKTKYDPEIHLLKKPFMQCVADHVGKGYSRFICGEIPLKKVADFADKFDRRYNWSLDKDRQYRARKEGMYTTRLEFYLEPDTDNVHWYLFVLPRETKKDEQGSEVETRRWVLPEAADQKWRDVQGTPRLSLTGYELVRLPKRIHSSEKEKIDTLRKRVKTTEGEERKKIEKALHRAAVRSKNSTVLTWRYTRDRIAYLREGLIRAIRNRRNDEINKLIKTIHQTPGFSETRDQVHAMRTLILSEWKRTRGSEPLPEMPKIVGFLRRVEHKTMRASLLLREREKRQNEVEEERKRAA